MGDPEQAAPSEKVRATSYPRRRRRVWRPVLFLLVVYVAAAYLAIPLTWRYLERHRPTLESPRADRSVMGEGVQANDPDHIAFDGLPTITSTASGIPGDPLNVGLIGTETDLKTILLAAQWYPADPLTLRSCLEIAAATMLKRPYDDAPVSNLYLFGRREDLAFEQPVGQDPRQRHHVRFWRCARAAADNRPVWIGSATFDTRVGFSHTTGQITHHIAADVDAERDQLLGGLEQTGRLLDSYFVASFQQNGEGRNGGGDPWHTDRRLHVGVATTPQNGLVEELFGQGGSRATTENSRQKP